MDKERQQAHLAVLMANVLFGVSYAAAKLLTGGFISSYGLNVCRILVSLPLFWILLLFKPSSPSIAKEDLPRFIICGLCGVTINQIMFLKGVSLTSTIHASLLSLGTPIFITAAAAWLLHEKLTRNKIFGLVFGLSGAALLMAKGSSHKPGDNIILGDIFILINSISYAFYLVWVRPLMKKYNPIHVMRWVFVFGGLMILPFGWHDFMATDFSAFNSAAWGALIVVALGATFLAYLFNIYGLKTLGPAVTGSYIYSQPVFATVIAISLLGEPFRWYHLLAAAMVFTGVWLVNKQQNQR